jgi:hypothetical protein
MYFDTDILPLGFLLLTSEIQIPSYNYTDQSIKICDLTPLFWPIRSPQIIHRFSIKYCVHETLRFFRRLKLAKNLR